MLKKRTYVVNTLIGVLESQYCISKTKLCLITIRHPAPSSLKKSCTELNLHPDRLRIWKNRIWGTKTCWICPLLEPTSDGSGSNHTPSSMGQQVRCPFLYVYIGRIFIYLHIRRRNSQIYYPYPDFFPTGRLSATLKGVSIVPNQPFSQTVNSCLSKCVFSVCTVKIYLTFIHRMYSTYVKFLSLRNFCIWCTKSLNTVLYMHAYLSIAASESF